MNMLRSYQRPNFVTQWKGKVPFQRGYHTSVGLFAKQKKTKMTPSQNPPANLDVTTYPPNRIRNFSIISHIDHGKTTLSSKLLTVTGTLGSESNPVYLDKLQVEKQRGITVKAQAATMIYKYGGEDYMLNLIDTPGHVDFSYEVSRSLRACEGVVLLVDAISGVQAQTMANFWLAYEANLIIVPAINKVDMKNAQIGAVTKQMCETFGVHASTILQISARTGLGVNELLDAIVERIPAPNDNETAPFRSLLFDSWYGNEWSGVVCLIKVVDGEVKIGDEIRSHFMTNKPTPGQSYTITDVGIMYPEAATTGILKTGQVGYITCGMKTTKEAMVGDTIYAASTTNVVPFPGFKEPKPMVFGGIYPSDTADFFRLSESLEKLVLTDPSVVVQKETNDVLGLGFRCGFLGMLHMDVFSQRLQQEHGTSVIMTAPTVTFRVRSRGDDKHILVSNPSDWPPDPLHSTEEPVILATIVCPKEYMGAILKLCGDRRGEQQSVKFIDETRTIIRYKLPLVELLQGFYDKLKSISSGYATFEYEDAGYITSDLIKVTIMLNGEPVGPLSIITHRLRAHDQGKALAAKLKELIKRQQFEVAIQAAIGTKIIARETIKAFRKDVTAKCYGGDITRKRKLLERQKEGKKAMRRVGRVDVPQEAFLAILKV